MMIATRTNALIFSQLDFMDHLGATRAFLKKTLWDLTFLALRFQRWSFEKGHDLGAGGGRRMNGNRASLLKDTGTFAQGRTGG